MRTLWDVFYLTCAGSWSQVLSRKLYTEQMKKKQAMDLHPIGEGVMGVTACRDTIAQCGGEDTAVVKTCGESTATESTSSEGESSLASSSTPAPRTDEQVKIVAVDLQAMAPLPGVIQIQGDITKVTNCSLGVVLI